MASSTSISNAWSSSTRPGRPPTWRVATGEFGHEEAGYVGEERIGIHRSIEHPWRDHTGEAPPGCKGGRLPVTKGDPGAQALASLAAAMPPRHVGAGPGFVDENQSCRIEVELAIEPLFTLLQGVGAILTCSPFSGRR